MQGGLHIIKEESLTKGIFTEPWLPLMTCSCCLTMWLLLMEGMVDCSQHLIGFCGLTIWFQLFDLVSMDGQFYLGFYKSQILVKDCFHNSCQLHSTIGNLPLLT